MASALVGDYSLVYRQSPHCRLVDEENINCSKERDEKGREKKKGKGKKKEREREKPGLDYGPLQTVLLS